MPIHTTEREQACKTFFARARERIVGCKDELDNHFFAEGLRDVWSSFDALLALKFPDGNTNRDRRESFTTKYQNTFSSWRKTDVFNDGVNILMKLSPVQDMNTGKKYSIKDPENLLELLNFSYAVRGNLTHGSKHLEGDTPECIRNKALVEYSFNMTFDILEQALPKEEIYIT